MHRQLADIIRADIAAGRLKPGQAPPAETRLMQQYELGRQARGVLRSEGLVVTLKREGSYVRPPSSS
ncbi:GntR family transcriptional regulator [Nonomuraea fuscirosea]|uniref:GntR family transcriptional regulator n=1 Tax=Nonomuraea fuscirosea TaxID=1291556 RepID=UPI00341B97B1